MKHKELVKILLDHACGQLSEDEIKKNGGFQEYYIELHCRSFVVEAKITHHGDWDIRSCKLDTGCRTPPKTKVDWSDHG